MGAGARERDGICKRHDRFASLCGPHPALRATFSHASAREKGNLCVNLAPVGEGLDPSTSKYACLLCIRHHGRRSRLKTAVRREDRHEPGGRGAHLLQLGDEALRPCGGGFGLHLGDELAPAGLPLF